MLLAFFMKSFKEGLDPTLDELTNKYFNEMKAGAVAQNKGRPLPAQAETSIMNAAKARATAEVRARTTTTKPTATTAKPAALAGLKGAIN